MKNFFQIISICYISFFTLEASIIEATNVNNYVKSMNNSYSYIIKADKYIFNLDYLSKKYNFFNREKILSKSKFFKNGVLKLKSTQMHFSKLFISDGKIYLSNLKYIENNLTYKSKKCEYILSNDTLNCNHMKIYEKNKLKATKSKVKKHFD